MKLSHGRALEIVEASGIVSLVPYPGLDSVSVGDALRAMRDIEVVSDPDLSNGVIVYFSNDAGECFLDEIDFRDSLSLHTIKNKTDGQWDEIDETEPFAVSPVGEGITFCHAWPATAALARFLTLEIGTR